MQNISSGYLPKYVLVCLTYSSDVLLCTFHHFFIRSLFKEHPSWEIPSIAVSVSTRARREKYAFRIALEECIQGYFQKEHVSL
jgi:hypothetical protein